MTERPRKRKRFNAIIGPKMVHKDVPKRVSNIVGVAGTCNNIECKGVHLLRVDDILVCPKCALTYDHQLSDNTRFNDWEQTDKTNTGEVIMTIPTGSKLTKKEQREFIYACIKAGQIDEPQHRITARKVVKRAKEVIERLPSIEGGTFYTTRLTKIAEMIIYQCYDTRMYTKTGSLEKLGPYAHNISSRFRDDFFSIPKDIDVIVATAIYCGSEYISGLQGGILTDEIIQAVKPGGKNKKFHSQMFKFINTIKKKRVIELKFDANTTIDNYNVSNKYSISLEFFCNKMGFPMRFTRQALDLLEECIDKVWLNGKNPKNAMGACILHLIWGGCKKFKPYEYDGIKYSQRKLMVDNPCEDLVESLEAYFSVKGKVIWACEKKLKELHCGCSTNQ